MGKVVIGTQGVDALAAKWSAWYGKNGKREQPPKGAVTASTFAAINGTTVPQAGSILRYRAARGKLKTGLFCVPDAGGYVRKTRHWWE